MKLIFILCSLIAYAEALPAPQDFQELQTGALMAAGQIKEIIDNGAAAHDSKTFEMFGAKVNHDMAIGFGDAMKSPFRRRREVIVTYVDDDDDDSSSSESDDSSDSDEE